MRGLLDVEDKRSSVMPEELLSDSSGLCCHFGQYGKMSKPIGGYSIRTEV